MNTLPSTVKLDAADFTRTRRDLKIGPDVTLADLLTPGWWKHNHHKLKAGDIIEVRSHDYSIDVDLRVVSVEAGLVYVKLRGGASTSEAPEPVELPEVPDGYVVDNTETRGWRVRMRNPALTIAENLKTEAEAIDKAIIHAAKAAGDASIPENWRDLSWQDRRSLASKLTDDPIHNGEEANAAIEAALAKQAA